MVLLSTSIVIITAWASVAAGAEFKGFGPAHAASYNYASTTIFDRSDYKWKKWWCGVHEISPGVTRDAIWYAETYDRLNWPAASVQKVFWGTANASDWDGGHTCDPTVLRNVSILGQQYAYVMYYAGAKLYSDFQANDRYRGVHQWQELDSPRINTH